MALGATFLIVSGKWRRNKDLPRYQYQKLLHESKHGPGSWSKLHMQKEIFMQAIANFTTLVVPARLVC